MTVPTATAIAADAARSDRDVRLIGWVDQDAAASWLAHASLLIFTSRGPESLSRVLIEASALGVPIAAMNTGGTPDIVADEQTGLLSTRRRRSSPPTSVACAQTMRCGGGWARRQLPAPIERFDAACDDRADRSRSIAS